MAVSTVQNYLQNTVFSGWCQIRFNSNTENTVILKYLCNSEKNIYILGGSRNLLKIFIPSFGSQFFKSSNINLIPFQTKFFYDKPRYFEAIHSFFDLPMVQRFNSSHSQNRTFFLFKTDFLFSCRTVYNSQPICSCST